MEKNEVVLLNKVLAAYENGESLKIKDEERKAAKKLVERERCFWSIDNDHIMSYDVGQWLA